VAKKTAPLQSTSWCRQCDDKPTPGGKSHHVGPKHRTEIWRREWRGTPRAPEVRRDRAAIDQLAPILDDLEAHERRLIGSEDPLGPVWSCPAHEGEVPSAAVAGEKGRVTARVVNASVARQGIPRVREELKDGSPYVACLCLADFALRAIRGDIKAAASDRGRAPKRLPGIWARVCELWCGNRKITARAAWNSFPSAESAEGREASIYRDGNRLVEVAHRVNYEGTSRKRAKKAKASTTRERSITYDSFRAYLKAARKELSTN